MQFQAMWRLLLAGISSYGFVGLTLKAHDVVETNQF